MKKYFYSHIVETSEISLALGDLDMTAEERVHLLSLMESNIHHAILDTILSELSEEDKKAFLQHLTDGDHEKIWQFLNSRVEGIEEKIKKTAEDLKKEIHKDVEESKRE
ncbi:MAG: hypothetical protein AAB801_02195 [Patescibacteria group bacterium]